MNLRPSHVRSTLKTQPGPDPTCGCMSQTFTDQPFETKFLAGPFSMMVHENIQSLKPGKCSHLARSGFLSMTEFVPFLCMTAFRCPVKPWILLPDTPCSIGSAEWQLRTLMGYFRTLDRGTFRAECVSSFECHLQPGFRSSIGRKSGNFRRAAIAPSGMLALSLKTYFHGPLACWDHRRSYSGHSMDRAR